MNDYLLSVILGIIEGVTEFLPISSTAHLRIAEAWLNVSLSSGYWKMYTIVIQLGAILCLPVYFRDRILKLLSTFRSGGEGSRSIVRHPLVLVAVAFVVTAIPSFLLSKLIGENLENLRIMGYALVIGGVVMWIVDRWARSRTMHMEDMTLGQAIWIGACQILAAVFPGTSRSMSTIAAGQLAGMSRAAALEFSFFLSIPTMAVATGYDLLKSVVWKGREPYRRGRYRHARMDRPGDRPSCFVSRRVWLRCMADGMGSYAGGLFRSRFIGLSLARLC